MNNILIIIDNFNIRNSNWDSLYPHYSIHSDILHEVADSLNLDLSMSINSASTWYSDNHQDSNLLIDLIFLYTKAEELNNYHISPNLRSSSNHPSLLVLIIIKKEFIQEWKQTIIKNSEEEKEIVKELRNKISDIDMTNIFNSDTLKNMTQEFATIIKDL